jgi:hypothetical protein
VSFVYAGTSPGERPARFEDVITIVEYLDLALSIALKVQLYFRERMARTRGGWAGESGNATSGILQSS